MGTCLRIPYKRRGGAEDNNLIEDKHLTHEITEYQQEVNTKRDKNAMWVRLMHHYVGY